MYLCRTLLPRRPRDDGGDGDVRDRAHRVHGHDRDDAHGHDPRDRGRDGAHGRDRDRRGHGHGDAHGHDRGRRHPRPHRR